MVRLASWNIATTLRTLIAASVGAGEGRSNSLRSALSRRNVKSFGFRLRDDGDSIGGGKR